MRASMILLICFSMIGLSLIGCGGGINNNWEKKLVSPDNADLRREGVLELMGQRSGKSDQAVKLFGKLATQQFRPWVNRTTPKQWLR